MGRVLNYPIGRATISEIETGRRRTVTVAELLILARALNTAPVSLVYPKPTDELQDLVEALLGIDATEFQAAQWFSGHGRHAFTDSTDGATSARLRAEYKRNTRPLEISRMIETWREKLYTVIVPLGGEPSDEQRDFIAYCEAEIKLLQQELAAVTDGND